MSPILPKFLWNSTEEDLLQGKVIDISDSGTQQEAFAVVEVEGLDQPVVVPMNRIRGSVCE